MRINIESIGSIGNAYALEEFDGARACRSPVHPFMQLNRFDHLLPHRHHRVEAGHRFLKDHRNLVAPKTANLGNRKPSNVAPRHQDLAVLDLPRFGDQPQDRKRGHRFAATRLPHQGEHFTRVDRKAHVVDDGDLAQSARKARGQVVDFEEWTHDRSLKVRGSSTSRTASPTMLTARIKTKSADPAAVMFHHTTGSRDSSLRA